MKSKILSFCIPNYNRFDHIKKTLSTNLVDNIEDEEDVEFIIIDFSGECEEWVRGNFSNELDREYLRYFRRDLGRAWHFGRAKNFFKEVISSRIYASLDGDNYTGYRGGKHIIDVFRQYNFRCVFHQFSGTWKDGSCGRISLPAEIYRSTGYDPLFFPRGYDDLDCILTTLKNNPDLTYVHYDGIENALRKQSMTDKFLKTHKFPIKEEPVPKNIQAKEPEYSKVGTSETQKEIFAKRCNRYTSFIKNVDDVTHKAVYEQELLGELIRAKYDGEIDVVDTVLWLITEREPEVNKEDIILCCVLKDAEFYFEAFLKHYRAIGVTKFFIIDNNSLTPVISNDKDVFIWQTRVGYFKYFKTFWIGLLLDRYAQENWCLTVDVDEFLVYEGYETTDLKELTVTIKRLSFLPCVLLDLYSKDSEKASKEKFRDYCVYYDWSDEKDDEYDHLPACKWAYGDLTQWFRKIDVRRRVFGTMDCLRKIPFFKHSKKILLNQGFHDLLIMKGKEWSWLPKDKTHLLDPRRYLQYYREARRRFMRIFRKTSVREKPRVRKMSLVVPEIFKDHHVTCGILLHYKFIADFPEQIRKGYESKQYFDRTNTNQKIMLKRIEKARFLYEEGISRVFHDSYSLPYPNRTKNKAK